MFIAILSITLAAVSMLVVAARHQPSGKAVGFTFYVSRLLSDLSSSADFDFGEADNDDYASPEETGDALEESLVEDDTGDDAIDSNITSFDDAISGNSSDIYGNISDVEVAHSDRDRMRQEQHETRKHHKRRSRKKTKAKKRAPRAAPSRPPYISEAQWAQYVKRNSDRTKLLQLIAGGGARSKPTFDTDFSDLPWSWRPNGGRVSLIPPAIPSPRPASIHSTIPVHCKAMGGGSGEKHGGKGQKGKGGRQLREADPPVLCDAHDEPLRWADLRAMCEAHSIASRPGSALIMQAPRWTALRTDAYGLIQAANYSASSTFPVETSSQPWELVRALSGDSAQDNALRNRIMLTPMAMYDARFDLLLNVHSICSTILPAVVSGVGQSTTSKDAGFSAAAKLLLSVSDHVIGISAKNGLKASSFWTTVWQAAKDGARNTVPRLSWCGGDGSSGSGNSNSVCERPWLNLQALRNGLKTVLYGLYTGPLDVSLYNAGSMLPRLRELGAAFKYHSNIFQGAKFGNTSLLNQGFNPAPKHTHAGTYMTGYNVIVTTMGALQSLPGASVSSNKRRPQYDLMYHTTCERKENARVPLRNISRLPVYDEVVVLTHRIEANIYHWTVETLGKLAPIIDYLYANPHVKIHVQQLDKPAPFREQHVAMLGLPWADRVVMGNIRAKVVHYPDNHGCRFPYGHWTLLLRERYRAALGLETALRSDGDKPPSDQIETEAPSERKPPASSGSSADDKRELTSSSSSAGSGAPSEERKRRSKTIVVLRRRNARRVSNEVEFITSLQALRSKQGYNITLIELADWRLPEQAAVFASIASADVVVGAHGAGQTNNIVAKPGACLIEVMPTDWLVPCYWRMAAHLGLRYTMFMVKGDRTAPITIAVRAVVSAVKDCLDRD